MVIKTIAQYRNGFSRILLAMSVIEFFGHIYLIELQILNCRISLSLDFHGALFYPNMTVYMWSSGGWNCFAHWNIMLLWNSDTCIIIVFPVNNISRLLCTHGIKTKMTRTVSWPTIFPSRLLSAFYCLSLFPMTYSVSDIVSTKLPYFLNQRPESFSPTAKGLLVKHYPSDGKNFLL